MADRAIFHAVLGAEAVAASTGYVLVDLSDTTNYPHSETNEAHLLGLTLSAETHSVGVFDIWVGVITEVDASNGTAYWLHCFHIQKQLIARHNSPAYLNLIHAQKNSQLTRVFEFLSE